MSNPSEILPLVTFEEFMLAGCSREHPSSFAFELEVNGPVDREQLNKALKHCSQHHPLLFSLLDQDSKNWQYDEEAEPVIQDGVGQKDLSFDLKNEFGLRLFISDSDLNKSNLEFVFHHACTDGIGAICFIKDVAKYYNDSAELNDSSKSAPNNETFQYLRKFRTSYGRNRFLHLLRWPLDLLAMLWSFEMVFNHPVPIKSDSACESNQDNPISPSTQNQTIACELTPEQTRRVKTQSKAAGLTVNDRIICSVFAAIDDWNKKFNPSASDKLIRIMIPMNLRVAQPASAANMVAMINVDRRVGKWKSKRWFQRLLSKEMSIVKKLQAGITANRFLQLQKQFLGRWPMQEDQQSCFASCVVSNLGDLSSQLGQNFQFGNSRLVAFRLRAPLREHTNVFIAAFSLADQLNFNVTFNSKYLNQFQSEFLLDLIRQAILQPASKQTDQP